MAVADPESDNNLIVCGFRTNQRTGAGYEGYVYQSSDNGNTWLEVLVDAESQWVSEESCTFGPDHQAYFATGVSDTSRGKPHHESGHLHIYRSSDGGRTWRTIQVERFMDWTSMTVDSTAGAGRNTLYIFANNLADGAGGWSSDKKLFLASRRELPGVGFSVINGSFNAGKARAIFPMGSAVLSDGTVLTVFTRDLSDDVSRTKMRYSVELGISTDGGMTLNKTTVYQTSTPPVVIGLAKNETSDEIYVCWTPRHGDSMRSELMLASSRDRGRTWRVRMVKALGGGSVDVRVGSASLAINKDGVLGFMWYGRRAEDVYLGLSFDGGDSLGKVVMLTPDLSTGLSRDTRMVDERRLFVSPPVWNTLSRRLEPLTILGLGTNPFGVPSGNALSTDRNGIFHPVWNEITNGPIHLWTRAISLEVPGRSKIASSIDGLNDISDRVVWGIRNIRFDHLENLVAFDVVVTNKSETTFDSPMLVAVARSKGQATLAAYNADNGKPGEGALWQLQIPTEGLLPDRSTDQRTLSFRLHPKTDAHTSSPRMPEWVPKSIILRTYANAKLR